MKAIVYRRILPVIAVLMALSLACSFPAANLPTGPAQPVDSTQSAQTVEAIVTRMAAEAITITPAPGSQAQPTQTSSGPTVAPSPTLAPSATPQPTATRVTMPTATSTPDCNQFAFVSDVSVPDGSTIPAGSNFTKTWRLRNTGSCVWSADYAIVFDSGDSMGGPAAQNLPQAVGPGDTVDVSVSLTAPKNAGSYRGYWRMRNPAGVLFGSGAKADKFYVDIKVVSATASGAGYDFAANYCSATWTANGNTIPCSGRDGSTDGFVLYISNPKLETGYQDDEPALITNPPKVNDGVIRGKFPSYNVKSGDYFETIIGCAYDAKNCSVRFQLDYQLGDGSIQTLSAWVESNDNAFTNIHYDLSSLAGKDVKFILTVMANGESNNDRAQWLAPQIKHK